MSGQNGQKEVWSDLITGPKWTLYTAMQHVARGLTDMVGHVIVNDAPQVKEMPVAQVQGRVGAPGTEIVAIYLHMESGLRGRAVLILPLSFALNLVDLMMEAPRGTATSMGLMERSALGEVGNLALSFFLNSVAESASQVGVLQPSPPSVIVGAPGTVLNMVVTSAAAMNDELLIVETAFADTAKTVEFRFWVLPDPTINWAHD